MGMDLTVYKLTSKGKEKHFLLNPNYNKKYLSKNTLNVFDDITLTIFQDENELEKFINMLEYNPFENSLDSSLGALHSFFYYSDDLTTFNYYKKKIIGYWFDEEISVDNAEFSEEKYENFTFQIPDSFRILVTNNKWFKVYAQELAYMRKPFRHSSTSIKYENNTVSISVDNFTDKGVKALELLRTITKESDVYLTYKNLSVIKKLGEYSNNPKYWRKNILRYFYSKDKKKYIININW